MPSISKLLMPLALVAVLAACSDEPEPTPEPTAQAEPAPTIRAREAVKPEAPPKGVVTANGPVLDPQMAEKLDKILGWPHRVPQNTARDIYRHPKETLAFFGLQQNMTVIEITPGNGWYAEILAPLLKNAGRYVAAVWDESVPDQPDYRARLNRELEAKFRAQRKHYQQAEVRRFNPKTPSFGPPGSADMVLSFRNAHNWIDEGTAPAYFKAFASVLKPGGVLGIVDHRAATGAATDGKSGYVTEEQIIDLALAAGFILAEKSEVNANAKDTRDHPEGVWTLPPTLALGDTDKDKYLAIGESDRMTLKFLKP
jgi:predicted methyltransferase